MGRRRRSRAGGSTCPIRCNISARSRCSTRRSNWGCGGWDRRRAWPGWWAWRWRGGGPGAAGGRTPVAPRLRGLHRVHSPAGSEMAALYAAPGADPVRVHRRAAGAGQRAVADHRPGAGAAAGAGGAGAGGQRALGGGVQRIYTQEHTRVAATRWLVANVPAGPAVSAEGWDDRLPLPVPGLTIPAYTPSPITSTTTIPAPTSSPISRTCWPRPMCWC